MKKLKIAFLSLFAITLFFSSCSNNDSIVEQPDTQESASITTALDQLRTHFNDDGSLNRDGNDSGNIIFDFCFDFVYPLNLSYNTGATVTVNNMDELVDVMINSTDDLYINGISYPFNVEVYNDTTGSVEEQTINSEEDFIMLLESCDFNDLEPCDCTDDLEPVCVEIQDINGETFVISYPNACVAQCDGFTEADFIECDGEIYNDGGFGGECFTINYPLSIIDDNGNTIVINSEEEFANAMYSTNYFEFAYPISVTMVEDNSTVQINSDEEFFTLLETCFPFSPCDCDMIDDPVCVEMTDPAGQVIVMTFPNACFAECEGFSPADFVDCGDINNPCDCDITVNDPVCVELRDPATGQVVDIITFPNACFAECEGFTSDDFVECI